MLYLCIMEKEAKLKSITHYCEKCGSECYAGEKQMEKNKAVRAELGKWSLDVGKYIATAVLIAGFFGNVQETWVIIALGIALTTLFVVFGISLIKK